MLHQIIHTVDNNQNWMKGSKVVRQRIIKRYSKILGTGVIKQSNVSSLPGVHPIWWFISMFFIFPPKYLDIIIFVHKVFHYENNYFLMSNTTIFHIRMDEGIQSYIKHITILITQKLWVLLLNLELNEHLSSFLSYNFDYSELILIIIIGMYSTVHQFIVLCLIPQDPWGG